MPNFFKYKIRFTTPVVIVLTFAISLFSLYFATSVNSQNPKEKAKEDYVFQFAKYRDSQESYLKSKAGYEQFKTAISKSAAYLNTKKYLLQALNLYESYILYVKEAGNTINWEDNSPQREKTLSLLEGEITYFTEVRKKIESTQTLEELPPVAEDIENRLKTQTELKLYKVLAIYELTQAKSTQKSMDETILAVENYIVQKQIEETITVKNWKTEIENLKKQSNDQIEKAQNKMSKTKDDTAQQGDFSQISRFTQSVDENLRRSQILFLEILRLI